MSRPVEYFQRLIDSLPEFEAINQEWIDRKTVQDIVGVGSVTAWRILKQIGGVPGPGGALMCSKYQMVGAIRQLEATGQWACESNRRQRVESNLAQLAGAARARAVEIARDSKALELLSATPDRLPEGIGFEHGRLVVAFSGPVDLLQKLFALVSACKNEPEAMLEYIGKKAD